MMNAADPSPAFASLDALATTLEGVTLQSAAPLARRVSMGVGGPARWLVTIDRRPALAEVVALLRREGIPWMILGGGSNTIFGPAGFGGAVLQLGPSFRQIELGPQPDQVTAGAAAPLSAVMQFARRAGLAGLEWAAGVPGQLGGALAGNAGTSAGDTCSLASAVEVLDAQGQWVTRQKGQWNYGYRRSDLRRDLILQATLSLSPDSPEAIQGRMDAALAKRGTQPIGVRCSGCIFKNPPGDHAGRLIDAAGLKGLRIGGAVVATEHANFILNDGSATADDVARLITEVQNRVKERWGIQLELEVLTVGLDSDQGVK